MKYCIKADANIYSLTCILLLGSKLESDCKNNFVPQCTGGNIILDHCIKTHNGWVDGVMFLWETSPQKAQWAKSSIQKCTNNLHSELGHQSEVITHDTGIAMGLHLTGTFKPCKDCILWEQKRAMPAKRLSSPKFWDEGGSLTSAHNQLPLLEVKTLAIECNGQTNYS